MEENIRMKKEYSISFDMFRKAYSVFQKKYVYPKSYLFMALFLVIAVIYIFAAVKDTSNTFTYVLIFLCLAMAFREWYNPRKIRRTLVDTVREMGDVTYMLKVKEESIEIETVMTQTIIDAPDSDVLTEEETDDYSEIDELPEKSVIPINSDLTVQECDEFFLLYIKKQMFYIVPKLGFDDSELEIMRNLQ